MDLITLYANNLGGMGPGDCTRLKIIDECLEGPHAPCNNKTQVEPAQCQWGDTRAIVYGNVTDVMVPDFDEATGEPIGEHGPVNIDVMVTNVTEDPNFAYRPEIKRDSDGNIQAKGGVFLNGIKAKGTGEFGVINVGSPSNSKLAFDFIDAAADEPTLVPMPNFAITFYDFDCQGEPSDPASNVVCERIQAGGFEYFYVTTTTELVLEVPTNDGCNEEDKNPGLSGAEKAACFSNTEIYEDPDVANEPGPGNTTIKRVALQGKDPSQPSSGFIRAKATQKGTGQDNPRFATGLTKQQLDRSITFIYKNADQMKLAFEVEKLQGSATAVFPGRNFLFSFEEPFTIPCERKGWTALHGFALPEDDVSEIED